MSLMISFNLAARERKFMRVQLLPLSHTPLLHPCPIPAISGNRAAILLHAGPSYWQRIHVRNVEPPSIDKSDIEGTDLEWDAARHTMLDTT